MQMEVKKVSELESKFQPGRTYQQIAKSNRGKGRQNQWSKERIVREIQQRHEAGKSLRWSDVVEDNKSLEAVAVNYFGSWYKAVLEAGFNPRDIKSQKWNKKEVVGKIYQRKQAGKPLHMQAVEQDNPALLSAAISHFGGWAEAIECAGLDYREIAKGVKPKEMREARRSSEERIMDEIPDGHVEMQLGE